MTSNKKEDSLVLQVKEYVDTHFHELGLSVKTIARAFDARSGSAFNRKFSRRGGISLPNYITKVRIDAAKLKLAGSAQDIKVVAYDCGFKTPPHFTRVFKEQTGKTPTDFRNSSQTT